MQFKEETHHLDFDMEVIQVDVNGKLYYPLFFVDSPLMCSVIVCAR